MSEKKQRTRQNEEFKKEAVRQLETRGSRKVSDVAQSMGVPESQLYAWRKKYGAAVRGEDVEGGLTVPEAENAALRKRVRELEQEREILKKATAFFVKESR